MAKGFSHFIVKASILWAIIIAMAVMTAANPETSTEATLLVEGEEIAENTEMVESEIGADKPSVIETLKTIGMLFGVGAFITVIFLLGSRCPKCGKWFAMGHTNNERIQIGVKSKTRTKFGLGALFALFDWRLWWLGLRSGGSSTVENAIYGVKKTTFCLECGFERIKMPKSR